MEEIEAATTFGALAYPHRLRVFRLLIARAPHGYSAGEIAELVGVPASSLSFHLSILQKAGLISVTRRQRQLIYSTDIDGTRALIEFLTQDCCNGSPQLCGIQAAGEHAHDNA